MLSYLNALDNDKFPKTTDRSQQYMLILMKNYCFFEREKVVPLLRQQKRILIEQIGPKTIKCFTSMLPSDFFLEIVLDECKELSHLP